MRPIHLLKPLEVERAPKRKGILTDGGGLYLRSDGKQQCSWLFRFTINGQPKWMGLGSFPTVTLADARDKAAERRKLLANDVDPLKDRDTKKQAVLLEQAKRITFAQCADQCIRAHKAGWRSTKHGKQWDSTLKTYAFPAIGSLPVGDIDTSHVLKVLQPIWTTKTETATRVRQRIERVMDYATAAKYRVGENPARWRGNLQPLLADPTKVRQIEHHAALPYADMPGFFAALHQQPGMAARALEFAILTAMRTGEVLGAQWKEVDFKAKLWTVPASRMKMKKEHVVPLSTGAIELLKSLSSSEPDAFIFPGIKEGKPLSNMALLMTLRRMGHPEITTHGMRSSFRDWAGDYTNFDEDAIELCLAHKVGDKVRAAYRRGDGLAKRVQLMQAWATYCTSPLVAKASNVVQIGAAS